MSKNEKQRQNPYACRDETCILRPLPPGRTRQELYCPLCRADKCLFTGRPVIERLGRRQTSNGWITVREFAAHRGCTTSRVYTYIRNGMPAKKEPCSSRGQPIWTIRTDIAEAWIEKHIH